jgi:hypothetical protein
MTAPTPATHGGLFVDGVLVATTTSAPPAVASPPAPPVPAPGPEED